MSDTTNAIQLSPEAIEFETILASATAPLSDLDLVRLRFEALHRATREPEEVTYREVDAGGVPGIWAQPLNANTDFVLLHAHAGGTVVSSANVDRKLAGHIAKAVGVPILVVDFRLSPESKYPAQLDDMEAAFRWLLGQGYPAKNIIAIGHSIGGTLAVAIAQRFRDGGQALPGAIVAISPAADIRFMSDTILSNADTDKVLNRPLIEFMRESWIGGTGIEPDDPRVSLNLSDLGGLPPTLVSWGTYEILAGEDEVLARLLREAGVTTHALPVVGAQHSYIVSADRVPETDRAIAAIAEWVRAVLPIATG